MDSKVNDIGSIRLSEIQIKWLYRVSLLVLVFTALRGARFPSLWTYSHYLFNYEFGFVKRGLIGEIVRLIDSDFIRSYDFFYIFSSTILLIDLMLIAIVLKRLFHKGDIALIGIGFCYASSVAVVFLVHTIGYFDHIGLMIVLIMILLRSVKQKLVIGIISLPVLLLIHEALIVIFGPLIAMIILLETNKKNKIQFVLMFVYLLFVGVSTLIVSDSTISVSNSELMQYQIENKTKIRLESEAFDVLHKSISNNKNMMLTYWKFGESYRLLLYSIVVTLPFLMIVILFLRLNFSIIKYQNLRKKVVVYCSLSPLLLLLVAYDVFRWFTMSLTLAFLIVFFVTTSQERKTVEAGQSRLILLVIIVFFLNGITSIYLFGNSTLIGYPYFKHIRYLLEIISGSNKIPIEPTL